MSETIHVPPRPVRRKSGKAHSYSIDLSQGDLGSNKQKSIHGSETPKRKSDFNISSQSSDEQASHFDNQPTSGSTLRGSNAGDTVPAGDAPTKSSQKKSRKNSGAAVSQDRAEQAETIIEDLLVPNAPNLDSAVFYTDQTGTSAFIDKIFDLQYYLNCHVDLSDIYEQDKFFDFKSHYIYHGQAEGRSPSMFFDLDYTAEMLRKYYGFTLERSEVVQAFCGLPSYQKFVPNQIFSAWAFRELYCARFPEISDATDYELFEFYLDHKSAAGLSPNGLFSEERYRLIHQDIASAIAASHIRSGFVHFVLHGSHESRMNLPGLHDARMSVERRYVLGERGQLEPLVWWFDERFYLSVYTDVHDLVRRGVAKSGLEHFLVVGFREKRLPSPRAFLSITQSYIEMSTGRQIDPWAYFDAMSLKERPPGTVDVAAACRIVRWLCASRHAVDKDEVSSALWPHVASPAIGGTFNAEFYVAANPDVGEATAHSPGAADHHWRTCGAREGRLAPNTNLFSDRIINFQDMLDWKSGVNFFGPTRAATGLGQAARGYVSALEQAGISIQVYDTSWLTNPGMPADLYCAEDLRFSVNFFMMNADQIQLFTSRYGTEIFNHRANVAAWVWELATPRAEWRSILSAFDLIITPSSFCTSSFAQITSCPVITVPYVVSAQALEAARDTAGAHYWNDFIERKKATGNKIVLFIMDSSSYEERKGADLFRTLAAQVTAKHPDRFTFILKSHSKDGSRRRADASHLSGALEINALFDFPDLCRLKSLADIYVSPHRAEGFGLNMIESILLGVPTLCSDYSGATELLADAEPPLVPAALREIERDQGPYLSGAIWCEPDLRQMERMLLDFFDGKFDTSRFDALRATLRTKLDTSSIGDSLKCALTEWCGLGAEHAKDRLQSFSALVTTGRAETFALPVTPGQIPAVLPAALRPYFSVITPTFNSNPEWLEELYHDLLRQTDPHWEWCIADDGSTRPETLATIRRLRATDVRIKAQLNPHKGISDATNAAVSAAIGRYLIMIDHDDRVSAKILETYRSAIDTEGEPDVLYCDEDKIDVDGNLCDIYLKPDWSPEHLMSCMYVLHCLCIRKSTFLRLGGYRASFNGAQDHDFVLRCASAASSIHHVDELLYHWRKSPTSAAAAVDNKAFAFTPGLQAVTEYLANLGVAGRAEVGILPGTYRPRPHVKDTSVSFVILTGCKQTDYKSAVTATTARMTPSAPAKSVSTDDRASSQETYVERFVASILANDPTLDYEIVVVVDSENASLLGNIAERDSRIRVETYDPPGAHFNFSHKANYGVRHARHASIVLLNDDMEAFDRDWAHALLEMLEIPGVGVAGGRLLYDDDTVQHCGIVMGLCGPAGHILHRTPVDAPAYNGFNNIIRNYSAVTGAMMAFRRQTFERVHGFDIKLPLDFNDVDFCLRVGNVGLRTVYTPFAQLRHFESRSAQRTSVDPLDRERFASRWNAVIARDPFFHKNMSHDSTVFEPTIGSEF
jgi:GT2 family glycosyltransferase/glycosyltransferase involved in cell wall biosynthesis